MHFSTSIHALAVAAGLLVTSVAAEPAQNLAPRATSDSSVCSASYTAVFSSAKPMPTDGSLSSWLAANPGTTASVPSSLQSAYCTYDRSRASWVNTNVLPYISSCSDYLGTSEASSYSATIKDFTTTATWCSDVTKNWAPARETGFIGPGVLAAAGLVAAVL